MDQGRVRSHREVRLTPRSPRLCLQSNLHVEADAPSAPPSCAFCFFRERPFFLERLDIFQSDLNVVSPGIVVGYLGKANRTA